MGLGVGSVRRIQRQGSDYPQLPVENVCYGGVTQLGRLILSRRGAGAKRGADLEIEIPELAEARYVLVNPLLCLIARIAADAEERCPLVIEQIGARAKELQNFEHPRRARRAKQAQHDSSARHRVELIAGVAGGASLKPRDGVAGSEERHGSPEAAVNRPHNAYPLETGMFAVK